MKITKKKCYLIKKKNKTKKGMKTYEKIRIKKALSEGL